MPPTAQTAKEVPPAMRVISGDGSKSEWEVRSHCPHDLHWALYVGHSLHLPLAEARGALLKPVPSHQAPEDSTDSLTGQWFWWWLHLVRQRAQDSGPDRPVSPSDPNLPAAATTLATFVHQHAADFLHWWNFRQESMSMKRRVFEEIRGFKGGAHRRLLRELNLPIKLYIEVLGVTEPFAHVVTDRHLIVSPEFQRSPEYLAVLEKMLRPETTE